MPKIVRAEGIYQLDTITYTIGEERKAAGQLRDRAMWAVERASFPHSGVDSDAIRSHIETLLRTHDSADDLDAPVARHLLRTGSPAYRRLFARHMRGETLTGPEQRAMKVTGSAGALLPFTLDPTIVPVSSGAINPLRSISKIETTTTNVWKGVTSAGIASGYGGEGEEVGSDGAPTFAQPEVVCERGDAWVPAAYEIDQDVSGLEHQIAALLARSKDEDEAVKFIHGTGDNEPLGMLAQLTNVTETAESGKLKLADVEAVEAALPEGYVASAEWLGHRDVFRKVSRFDAEGSSQPWVKFPGAKPELFGLTANELSSMDSATAAGKEPLVIGDFDYHVIVDRIGMSVSLIPEFSGTDGRPTGSMGVFALWRNGTKVLSPEPFRLLKVKA
jgi:HK97 family phage major capsid protein